MRLRLIVAFLLLNLYNTPSYSQNIDSISRVVDSSSKRIEQVKQEFDSLQNSKNLEEFLRPMEEREEKQKIQTLIYISLGVAFLVLLIYRGAQNKKNKKLPGA